MKLKYIAWLFLIGLLVAAFMTNPSEDLHKKQMKETLRNGLSKALQSNGLSSDNAFHQTLTYDLYENIVWSNVLEKGIKRKNYYFFSTSEINYLGKSYTAGVGLFSRVYIFPQLEKEVVNRINDLINEGGGLKNLLK